ncbi:MAG: DUF3791 domain-containing protein [Bacteroidales bacterium]|nr:DUF3791 domain-containing protein [Bacteroidales bacterium]
MSQRKDIVEYIVTLINEFAKRFGLSDAQAYRYISRFKGIELVEEHYEIMHTLDFSETVSSLAIYCKRQGGELA